MKISVLCVVLGLIAGCANYGGVGLEPGRAMLQEVEAQMGESAMRWQEADGSQVLAYPRGPSGFHTFMAEIGADGHLRSLRNVLEPARFAMIREGMGKEEVLRLLGPPVPQWTVYFERRDELVWEWRYCDDWGEAARFDVLFDNASAKVRSTLSQSESQTMPWGKGSRRTWCSR